MFSRNLLLTLQQKKRILMKFDRILDNNSLWVVRNYLLDGGAIDADGFMDYLSEL